MKRKLKLFITFLTILSLILPLFVFAAHWLNPPGDNKKSDGDLTADFSNAGQGYVYMKATATTKKLKLRVQKGEGTIDFDLSKDGSWDAIPLSMGEGKYSFTLYINTSGNKYRAGGKMSFDAVFDESEIFSLYPNKYISYDQNSQAVKKAEELCQGKTSAKEKYEAVREYMKANFLYDYIKAYSIQPGTLPDVEGCFTSKMGICQDLAAIAIAMLRTQGVKSKMAVGYADTTYHAWVIVDVEGESILYDPTADATGITPKTYTVDLYY